MRSSPGRYLFAVAAIASGICGLVWHRFDALGNAPHREILVQLAAGLQLSAGIAVLWTKTARAGAVALAAIYLSFTLRAVPEIARHPLVYNSYGNVLEQLSMAAGAAMLFALCNPTAQGRPDARARVAYYTFALCTVSFTLEQFFYLRETASLVPGWIPPSRMFWAIATTIAFGLAALALLSGIRARLAAQLTTAMLVGFGLLTWVPLLVADHRSFFNWSETAETFAIAGAAWMMADFLSWGRRAEVTRAV